VTEIAGKRLEFLRDVVPSLHRLAILADVGYPASVLELGDVQTKAHALGLDVASYEITQAEDIAPVFEALNAKVEALYVVESALLLANISRMIPLALGARLPTIFNTPDVVRAGGLMSYGPDYQALFRPAFRIRTRKVLFALLPLPVS
jgi:putative ABC transport system substrate-binding protein